VHPGPDPRFRRVLGQGHIPGGSGVTAGERFRERADRRVGVHEPDRERRKVGVPAYPGRDLGQGQRVRAQVVDDVALDRDLLEVEDGRERGGEQSLGAGLGRDDATGRGTAAGGGSRQGVPVDLSATQDGELGDPLEVGRNHVCGQGTVQPGDQRGLVEGHAGLEAVVPDQLSDPRGRDVGGHDRLPDAGHRRQHGLDLAQLNPEPTDLHLGVGPPDVDQALPVGAHQVAAAVGPAPTEGGQRPEGGGVLVGIEVAGGTDPGDDQLADLPRAHRVAAIGVDDDELPARQRQSDAHRLAGT
jgi:hypothetical protein